MKSGDPSSSPDGPGSEAPRGRRPAAPGSPDAGAPCRVVFLPQWYTNPYLKRLDEGLCALGVQLGRFKQRPFAILIGVARTRPHVLHLHWLHPLYETRSKRHSRLRLAASLCGIQVLRLLGVRIVWTAHNLGHHEAGESGVDRACTRFIARRAAAIIVHGEPAKQRIVKELALSDADRVFVIPHGHYIDSYPNAMDKDSARRKLGVADAEIVLLFFGQIRPYKGVLELIDAFSRLEAGGARLIIAGRPLSDADGETVCRAAAGQKQITLAMDYVRDEDVQAYMQACDAVVLPYRDILTSGAAVLAMSFGRACVVPRLGCFTDLLEERGAVFYDPTSGGGLLAGLREAVRNHGRLEAMGAANLERAKAWDWGSIARRTLEAYEFALGRRDRASGQR